MQSLDKRTIHAIKSLVTKYIQTVESEYASGPNGQMTQGRQHPSVDYEVRVANQVLKELEQRVEKKKKYKHQPRKAYLSRYD